MTGPRFLPRPLHLCPCPPLCLPPSLPPPACPAPYTSSLSPSNSDTASSGTAPGAQWDVTTLFPWPRLLRTLVVPLGQLRGQVSLPVNFDLGCRSRVWFSTVLMLPPLLHTGHLVKFKTKGFPGGAMVENLPANAGDTGSSPGLGRSHMPRSN